MCSDRGRTIHVRVDVWVLEGGEDETAGKAKEGGKGRQVSWRVFAFGRAFERATGRGTEEASGNEAD